MGYAKIGYSELELYLPGIASLKEKRGILKSMLHRMRNQFNVANAEVGHHDVWQSSIIAVTTVSNSSAYSRELLQSIEKWVEENFPDVVIVHHSTEIL